MVEDQSINQPGEPEMTIAIYERVSSKGQDFASQHDDLEEYASRAKQPVKWYSDKFTGKTMDRPGMNALLEDMRSGKVKTVVVYRLDRLGRTAAGLTTLFAEFVERKVNFVSLKDGIDLGTAAGKLMANVLASVAAFETEVRSERQAAGIAAAKAAGVKWKGRPVGTMQVRTKELDSTVKKMKTAGQSVSSIARTTKISRNTVYAILKA